MNRYRIRLLAPCLACLLLPGLFGSVVLASPEQVQKLIADGHLDQALAMTNRELSNDAGNITYLFLKGLILTRQENLEQARDIFIGITRSNPELPEPYNNLAVIYAELGDFDAARRALEQAINTHPAYATAYENIGDIYAKLASQAYNQALELDRDNNTAKAKLSLVNDLFSLPAKANQTPVTLVTTGDDGKPALPVTVVPVPVREVPAPPAQAARVQTTADSEASSPAMAVREQPPPMQPVVPPSGLTPVATVKQAVLDWSVAWSSQNVNGYLAFYAGDFVPQDGRPVEQWRELRRQRLSQPGSIRVSIADLVVEMNGMENATATFTQSYESDTYNDRVKKTLILKLENNRWVITREQT